MKFPAMQLTPLSHYFIPLGPDILNTLFSSTLSLLSSLNVRDQVSHPYKTTGRILVLCILVKTVNLKYFKVKC
jgi:hypothetical protein